MLKDMMKFIIGLNKCIITEKSGITYIDSHNFAKVKVDYLILYL